MATDTEPSNEEILAEFDEDMALQRLEVSPEDLTDWDMDTAIKRAELEERLEEIDSDLADELDAIEAEYGPDDDDDEPTMADRIRLAMTSKPKARATFSAPGLVEFCAAGSPCQKSGDVVRRKGVIWRAGTYANQAFTMTPDELRELARTFRPVPIGHAHSSAPGPLDGAFGRLESVEMADDGETLLGTAVFPRWLEDALGSARRFVSATFDRASRRLRSLDLVTHPQITDAELLAAFAHSTPTPTRTATMSRAELDRRLSHTDLGRGILARRRAEAAATSPAAFSASAPSAPPLSAVARRYLEATANGRAALARRDNPTPPASPSTPPEPTGVPAVYSVAPPEPPPPIRVPDEAEGEFLAALWRSKGEAALTALDREIDRLTSSIAWHVDQYRVNDRMGWSGEVRPLAADRARLRAMREAMVRAKGGKAPAFRPPTPAAVAAAQAEAVVRGALSAGCPLRQGTPATRLPEVTARVETLRPRLAKAALPDGEKLAEVRERYHKDRLELEALEAELPALERAASGGLARALAERVAPIVAEAGGPESLARDLAEQRLMLPENRPPADPESAEKLAGLASKLADLGASPTSPGGGRIVLGLQERHAALVAEVESDRRGHREAIVARAEKVVGELMAGDAWALDSLVKAAEKQPKAFHPGLADRLNAALPEAVAEVGFLAYAHGI